MSAEVNTAPSSNNDPGLKVPKRLISIRWTLPLCVITPLISGIILTSWFGFHSGQKDAKKLTENNRTTEVVTHSFRN